MAATSIRWAATKHLIALMRDAPAATGVQIEPGWPGDVRARSQLLWVLNIDSTQEIPVSTGGRTNRDDFFTITFGSRVVGLQDLDATMARIDELSALIENPIADGPTLDDFDGIVSSSVVTTAMTCGRTPEGCLGWGRHEVQVHARLT